MISFVMMTWNLPATMLENSLWTLTHQSLPPREIVVAETSPGGAQHEETRAACSKYPLVRLVEAYWSRFNASRGLNVAIRATDTSAQFLAAVGMEMLFSENFVKVLQRAITGKRIFVCAACGRLSRKDSAGLTPEGARADWSRLCGKVEPPDPPPAVGGLMCAPREWWFDVRGFDEARRPYSYVDVDICDRAFRSRMVDESLNLTWDEAQVIHPWHPPSGLFYGVSGYPLDIAGADADIRRNGPDWGRAEGDEPVRIQGT